MLKNNVKKIIICIVSIVMVVAVASKTLAADNKSVLDEINEMMQNTNTTINENENIQQINEIPEENKQNEVKNLDSSNTQLNKNENAPTTTPYTGIGDYSSFVFMVIFAISAIYAYKKIRDYNI